MRKTGKRALALGLCVATAFAMTGCGGKTGETEPAAAAKTESQAAESTTAAAKDVYKRQGLGDGESGQWERALKLALETNCEHLNQIFPAAALSQALIRKRGNRSIVNALIRPTGRVGYVSIGTGPISEREDSAVLLRAVAAMLHETHVNSLKFFPIKGTAHLEELAEVARIAAEFGMMIEPTGGITPDNVEIVVRTCLEAGAVHVMPHRYGSLKDESGGLDFDKMDRAVEADVYKRQIQE